jgi:hypothetical protein
MDKRSRHEKLRRKRLKRAEKRRTGFRTVPTSPERPAWGVVMPKMSDTLVALAEPLLDELPAGARPTLALPRTLAERKQSLFP